VGYSLSLLRSYLPPFSENRFAHHQNGPSKSGLNVPVKKSSIASMNKLAAIFFGSLLLAPAKLSAAEDRRERVLNDRKEVEAAGHWIYNDLPKGLAEAARTGKPMLILVRCVP